MALPTPLNSKGYTMERRKNEWVAPNGDRIPFDQMRAYLDKLCTPKTRSN